MTKTTKPDLRVEIAGIKFSNPVIGASGTFGYGEEYIKYLDLNRIGGIAVKGLSSKPNLGNKPPRICETPAGMLNSIGLENIGVDAFIRDKLPILRKYRTRVLVNIFGFTEEEYIEVAEKLDSVKGIAGLEVNISCPNIKKGGVSFGKNPRLTFNLIKKLKESVSLPLVVKLTPNVSDITEIAQAAEQGGADALSLINTLNGMAIDIKTRMPKLGNITGGLSGPAIKPVALYMVFSVYKKVKLPLIGMGGIRNFQDAIEFFLAGATAVSVGTANFINPKVLEEIVTGIENFLIGNKIKSVKELIGGMEVF
ncbi:MAG: dihydroorotate dehydrogenase B catalytic subunit [Candidatus Schekmanbacteria bacterium RBG_16_38_11]|uniref:Dihydroorotate dehydrogenase n=1 Tax=Candidatus Schekmanbacteria bacterium RBG_16_38_11 TaxID=1817880 RepID=A0A1F7RYP5_9BACT|nr:MAG: dihydroorotate dehydrogenase B catalytic subunit [Candidatus Schekmanbacteria bacterium RBG_16_38_11]